MTHYHRPQRTALSVVAVSTLWLLLLSPVLTAAELPADQAEPVTFEARLASLEEVEGWESVPGPRPDQIIWISPEPTLTNADVTRAWYEPQGEEHAIGLLLTEEGALNLARATKTHLGDPMALMIDGTVTAAPRIMAPILGGRASIHGHFTEEEAKAIAAGIVGK